MLRNTLRDLLKKIGEERGILLDEGMEKEILREVSLWLEPSIGGHGFVRTEDGSLTFLSAKYGEPYHSLWAGAVKECLLKFLYPSNLMEKSKCKRELFILDVGFGLGYNVAVTISEIRKLNPHTEINIVSFEKELLDKIHLLNEPYRRFHKFILEGIPKFEKDGIRFELLLGDAREEIKEVDKFLADAVFHDAFSPYRNPELWSLDFLKEIRRLIAKDGLWVSYTSSLPVRKALKLLGFGVGSSQSVGRKRGGTVASLSLDDSLSQEELRKLEASPYAIPFRDKGLKEEPLRILIDYRLRVEILKMAQGGIEPPTPRFSAGCSTN